MPRNIKIIWIICCVIIFIGFVVISVKLQIREMQAQRLEQIEKDQELAKRKLAKKAKISEAASIIKNIKEMNALGQHINAAELAEKAALEDPENAMVHTWWGISLVKADKPGEAMQKFVKSAQLDPSHPQTFLYWGLTLAMQQDFRQAIEKYSISVDLDPDNSNAFSYWGAALGQLGEYDQAIEKLESALELNKFNELIYGVLVDSWYHKGEYQKAWEIVFRARNVKVTVADKSLKRLAAAMPEPQ